MSLSDAGSCRKLIINLIVAIKPWSHSHHLLDSSQSRSRNQDSANLISLFSAEFGQNSLSIVIVFSWLRLIVYIRRIPKCTLYIIGRNLLTNPRGKVSAAQQCI